MYRIVIWTSKGGTGKTTTAANVAPELARLGYRVLLVGFDPTTDLEATFGVNDDDEQVVRVEQLLDRVDAGRVWDATIPVDVERLPGRAGRRASGLVTGQLRLLACSPALAAQAAAVSRDGYRGLARVLEAIDDRVDLAVIDTQGALTTLSHAAAVAADGVVFVGEPGAYERRALEVRLVELEQLRQEGAEISVLGWLFIRCAQRSRRMRSYREHFAESFPEMPVFEAFIRQQGSIKDDPDLGRPTVAVEPLSHAAVDYRAFAGELAKRLGELANAEASA